MMHIAPLIILAFVCAVGIIGNILIIGSVILYKRIRVRGSAFIVNLAVADLITVAYIMPIGLVSSQYEENPIGHTMCQINAFLAITSLGVSTQTLMMIALERYFHICKMHIYKKAFTPKLIGLYITLIWIYTIVWTCQGWTGWAEYAYSSNLYICLYRNSRSYSICLAVFGMILPMVVLGVCYYKIFKVVVTSQKAMGVHREKSKGAKDAHHLTSPESEKQAAREFRLIVTLFTIVVVFVICWLPSCIVLGLGSSVSYPLLFRQISVWLSLSNSSVNSIIYGLLNKNFRNGYRYLLMVILCCSLAEKFTDSSGISSKKNSFSLQKPRSCEPTDRTRNSKSMSTESEGLDELSHQSASTPEKVMNSKSINDSIPSSLHLTPIKYDEEPSSGAPIRPLKQSDEIGLSQSGLDKRMSDPISPVSIVSSSEEFLNDSTSSQSCLLHRSVGDRETDRGAYGNQPLDEISASNHCNGLQTNSVTHPKSTILNTDCPQGKIRSLETKL